MRRFVAVLCGSVLIVAGCSADEGVVDTSATLSTTMTSTTALLATSSIAPTTTTTPPGPTTPPSPTATVAPSTTTTGADATVQLTDEGIYAGSTWVYFGYDDDDAVAAVSDVLGSPSEDSGWLDSLTDGWEQFGVCPSPRVRGVSWGEDGDVAFQLMFTDGDTDFWIGGVEHFYSFHHYDTSEPSGLTTPEGIGLGSTLGDLRSVYGSGSIVIEEDFFDPSLGYWAYDQHDWTGLWGSATGTSEADSITSINGGQGCGE
ncbi:MAG TPA: hypothetical protein VF148_07385 [Acidimicrobiia bacterium]